MAILNDLQALFAQCPVLQELAPRTDQIETDAEGYAILPTGSTELAQDMTGAVTWQYNFVLAATRMSADDVLRLDNCNFLERLQDWVQEQNHIKCALITNIEHRDIIMNNQVLQTAFQCWSYGNRALTVPEEGAALSCHHINPFQKSLCIA